MVAPAVLGGALAGAGALGGAFLSSNASKKAARQAANAQRYAADLQNWFSRDVIGGQITLGAPQREASYSAVAALMDMIGLPRTAAGLGMGQTRELDPVTRSRIMEAGYQKWADTWDKSRKYRGEPQHYQNFMNDFNAGRLPDLQAQLDAAMASAQSGAGSGAVPGSAPYNSLTAGHGITGIYELLDRPLYDWQTSPSYQWRLNQGYGAALAGLGSRGLGASGAELKALTEYGQGMASQEYDTIFNRLLQVAGFGGLAADQSSSGFGMGSNLLQSASNAYGNTGAALSAGTMGSANAWSTALNEIARLPWSDMFGNQKYTSMYDGISNSYFR